MIRYEQITHMQAVELILNHREDEVFVEFRGKLRCIDDISIQIKFIGDYNWFLRKEDVKSENKI